MPVIRRLRYYKYYTYFMFYIGNRIDTRSTQLRHEIIQEVEEFNYLGNKDPSDGRSCIKIVGKTNKAQSPLVKILKKQLKIY